MRLYSTATKTLHTDFLHATLRGLAEDGGLWMPLALPRLPREVFEELPRMGFVDVALHVFQAYIGDEVPTSDIHEIVRDAFTFDAPLVRISERIYALELFHGPTLAFKDFGARFMARAMSYARRRLFSNPMHKDLCVLVATSGDTGSAVAHGFWNVPGIRVVILYPQGKVSDVQERQLTTMGGNITALEIQGSFDDCQALVKRAFHDTELATSIELTSANSINIARLLPQSLYYFRGWAQLAEQERKNLIFCTPSGNFGNLTGGLFAYHMGLPVQRFLAATNRNDTFPRFLQSGVYAAQASVETPSNAMDVGNPSNFTRIYALYNGDVDAIRHDIAAISIDDEETLHTVARVEQEYGYVLCPHTAVGYAALERLLSEPFYRSSVGIVLATAHPAKFTTAIEPVIGKPIPFPQQLQECMHKEKQAVLLPNSYDHVRSYLLELYRSVLL
ncbi:MAG: threonine synthase [Bacteroidota bacterium]|nr:threonine synthase [Candidatus Kapabacteria bacterium]MDW8220658.1 threonine synthase [Bacteroidota bacterium]